MRRAFAKRFFRLSRGTSSAHLSHEARCHGLVYIISVSSTFSANQSTMERPLNEAKMTDLASNVTAFCSTLPKTNAWRVCGSMSSELTFMNFQNFGDMRLRAGNKYRHCFPRLKEIVGKLSRAKFRPLPHKSPVTIPDSRPFKANAWICALSEPSEKKEKQRWHYSQQTGFVQIWIDLFHNHNYRYTPPNLDSYKENVLPSSCSLQL